MIVNIINKQYRFKQGADGYFTLQKRIVRKEGKKAGEEDWLTIGHYLNLAQAARGALREIPAHELQGLELDLNAYQEYQTSLSDKLYDSVKAVVVKSGGKP